MHGINRYQVPSLGLILIGIYLGLSRSVQYVQYLLNPPSHRLGLAAEVVTLGFLLVAGGLIVIGVRGFRYDRPVLRLAVLVGVVIFWGTFVVDLYTISTNTQFVVALGLAVSVVPAVATYFLCRYTDFWAE